MPSAQPIRPSTTIVPMPRPPAPTGMPKPPPPEPPSSSRRSSMLSLRRKFSQRIPSSSSAARILADGSGRVHPTAVAGTITPRNLNRFHLVTRNCFCHQQFLCVLKSFFTLSRHDPRRRLSGSRVADRVALVIRVLFHECVASRGVRSDAPLDTPAASGRAYPPRRLRRRNGRPSGRVGRSRLRRSALQSAAPQRPQAARRFARRCGRRRLGQVRELRGL